MKLAALNGLWGRLLSVQALMGHTKIKVEVILGKILVSCSI